METAMQTLIGETLKRLQGDGRIGPSHISLFIAIVQQQEEKGGLSPIIIHRKELMPLAKISARDTFDKNMWDLHNYGYIRYIPSFSPYLGSLVSLSIEAE